MNTINFLPAFKEELICESSNIKYYIQKRFTDITTAVKSEPLLAFASLFTLAYCIYLISLPIFTFPVIVILDYLDNSYFDKKQSYCSDFYFLFYQLKSQQNLQNHQFLSKEDREYLSRDPSDLETQELLASIEKLDQRILEEQEAYKNDVRPILLFLKAKSDHNGALNLDVKDYCITINGDNTIGVQELKEKYKIVVIDNITHINQIKDGLEKITNTIQQVWILAHGTPTSMQLDDINSIEINNIDTLSDIMQKKLAKDAHVILYSCSTGKKVLSGENIATKFSKILPGRTIWAPKVPKGIVTVHLGLGDSITVNFWDMKSRLKFLREKIWNICRLRLFEKIEIELNVTSQVKDGNACL